MFAMLLRDMELQYKQEQHVRKPSVICETQLAEGLVLKMLKYFEVILKIFEFSTCEKSKNLDWY